MKQTIKWHEQCFTNSDSSLQRKRVDVAGHIIELQRWEERQVFRAKQIAEAKRRGIESYDGERFMIKRSKK